MSWETLVSVGFSGGFGQVMGYKNSDETAYMKMGMGGVGFSFGSQQYDSVILFQSADRLRTIIDGGWDAGAAVQLDCGRGAARGSVHLQVFW